MTTPPPRTLAELRTAATSIADNTSLPAAVGLVVTKKELACIRRELGRETTHLDGVRLCLGVSPLKPKDPNALPKRKGYERCPDCGADPGEACWDDPHRKMRPWY